MSMPKNCPKCQGTILSFTSLVGGGYRCHVCEHIFTLDESGQVKVFTLMEAIDQRNEVEEEVIKDGN